MLRFRSLGSGSTGNATLVEATSGGRTTRLLVDCGFGLKHLDARLGRAGLLARQIDAVFITHEHGDHIGCAHALSRRDRIPVWMSEGTWLATGGRDFEGRLNLARDGAEIAVGDLALQPFTVPHDAREPLQLVCTDGARRLGVLTDLGHATPYVLARLAGLDALLLECNHDGDLLAQSAYPAFLKQRVGGNYGHLSNTAAADIARAVLHDGLRHVVAAHLSEQNNRPDIVRRVLAEALGANEDEILTASAADGSPWLDL
ncbi:MBL fold metallo-hydrolase [Variovorax sp. J22G21]|uniref:MBL fold metallo-hydrolase n=1 Tax=Variovorax fucosicus TaxID=3053517 RepID=UPI002577AC83|nr:MULTISPECIES: MBL fold metallo-hydrolase [unclassified Variovorax]MDM0042219.1 MBL fold metallo-hydrolase [Variovorax sp. J22R193]MDM0058129.1 MBL fold metallo-hydrolase [Variovorax sp. J22G47]MDM0060823.1 MBL fold metallo-hydrolase [Variovorax sp. J22G21]